MAGSWPRGCGWCHDNTPAVASRACRGAASAATATYAVNSWRSGVLRVAERKESFAGSWLAGVMTRCNHNVVAVAQANKTARIVCALLAHDRKYDAHYGMTA